MNGLSPETFACCLPVIATFSIGTDPAASTGLGGKSSPMNIRPNAASALPNMPDEPSGSSSASGIKYANPPTAAGAAGTSSVHRSESGPNRTSGASAPALAVFNTTDSLCIPSEAVTYARSESGQGYT
ncbi:MAG: hypothetical protein GY794_25995 [bacterium]|nr:hypothetical protein [bacterium]